MKKSSRRSFIAKSSLAAGAIGTLNLTAFANTNIKEENIGTEKGKELQFAGYPVNRVKALINGKVKLEGFDIKFTKGAIGDLNTNMFIGPQSYDISEVGLHPFMLAYANDEFRDYTLLPIFPLRIFRHKSVFIRNDRGIKKPEDLKGKTIGVAGYSSSSLTWLRGIFHDEYGITPQDVNWIVSNKDSAAEASGKTSKQESVWPDDINIKMGPKGMDESDLLVSGEVDALFHAVEPKAYVEGNPLVVRLFQDSRRTEQDYYKKTGIFPIMHVVAINKKLIESYPGIQKEVFEAYSKSKSMDYAFMKKIGWAYDSLPWYGQEMDSTRDLMGDNFWPYGIEKNRKALETLFRYSYEQGLCSRELKIEELFEKSSLSFEE